MRKKFLILLSVLILSSTLTMAKPVVTSDLAGAIKLYKAGNYTACYDKLNAIVKKDPSNALAYYYLAITSAQVGKREEAIENYEKALSIAPSDSNIGRYAQRGKTCLESPDKCEELSKKNEVEQLLRTRKTFSEEVRADYEKLKLENMMRELNRSDDIEPQKFKEYKDFSSMEPTNDEIVAALRTLQRAGFNNIMNNNYSDLSMFNMMGNQSMNPQLIQTLLTNNMSLGF